MDLVPEPDVSRYEWALLTPHQCKLTKVLSRRRATANTDLSMRQYTYISVFQIACFYVVQAFVVLPVQRPFSLPRSNPRQHEILKAEPPGDFGEITNTLARLDRQWAIQQKFKDGSRWRKLSLSDEGDFVYLLEPPSRSIPSCLITFTGGAGLGTYPHIAYNEFLTRLSDSLNAAVLTAPYEVGLDHFELAKTTGDHTRRAIVQCQDTLGYSDTIPVYVLSHSLGSKLSCIYLAATQQSVDGVGLIASNNYSFSRTLSMAKDYAQKIGSQSTNMDSTVIKETLNKVFDFAETAINVAGFEFSPSPSDMERLLQQKYAFAAKTRLFSFTDDTLDDTMSFTKSMNDDAEVTELAGTHLTPVFFVFSVDELPEEAKTIMAAASDMRNASFGNEEELTALVSEVRNWILGKKREPLRITSGHEDDTEPSELPRF